MELNNKLLPEWLKSAPAELYPQGKYEDFYTHYKKLSEYLNDNVHKEVTYGANLRDSEILLNDHGVDHIKTVISRASYLVDHCNCNLSPYEVYILLCCIELHDVGNIFGRYNHEKNVGEIMKEAKGIYGRDTIEAILIKKIAESHGGRLNNGDKDKISTLEKETNSISGKIRPRLIASLLRLADELADDKTRAYGTLLKNGAMPRKSEIFHAYALCLQSVTTDHKESSINLRFSIPDSFVHRKFGKLDSEVLLIDEIYERLYKMHNERKYCMRFTKGQLDIESIRVHIDFYSEDNVDELWKMVFDVKESGYPESNNDLFGICPELTKDGTRLDGNYFITKFPKVNEKPF